MNVKRRLMMVLISLLLSGLTFTTFPVFARSQNTRNVADYPSIQDAIDSLPASGGTVFIPAGIYIISTPIKVPGCVTLMGAGFDTVLWLADGADCNVIENLHPGELVDERIVVRDLQIDGNGAYQTGGVRVIGVYLWTAPNSRIENVWFHDFPKWTISSGICLFQSWDTVVRCNIFENNSYAGIFLAWSDNCVVSRNYLYRNHRGIYLRNSDSDRVTKNVIINCDEGIRIYYDASNNRIIGNYIEGSSEEGIGITHAECENNFIVSNTFVDNRIDIDDKGTNTKMPHDKSS